MHHLLIHRVQIDTKTATLTGGRSVDAWSTSYASMRCRVEPWKATIANTIMGRTSQPIWHMLWGQQVVNDGDRVTFLGPIAAARLLGIPVGVTFIAREIKNSTMLCLGPGASFQTAELHEKK
ncbi:MAG: hypothetical protein ACYCW6_00020 [Candidatus Xenobia bacterium]